MKLIKVILFAFLAINTIGCKPSKKEDVKTEHNIPAETKTVSINIEGMTCEIGCAKTIEAKISKLEGVSSSKVDFEAKKGTFSYDSSKTCEVTIMKTIDNLLDGKTYTTNMDKKSCELKGDKTSCTKKAKEECTKTCAEKCENKEKENCKKACAEKCDAKKQ